MPTTKITFHRETINQILTNLGVSHPYALTNAQAKATLYNLTCNLAPTRVVGE